MSLDRNTILGMDDLPRTEVEVPEWNGSVYVRTLTGSERVRLSEILESGDATGAQVVALVAVDEEGNRLFSEDDVDALSEKNGKALERIVSAAMEWNFVTEDSLEAEEGN
jgi:hypothetical protein